MTDIVERARTYRAPLSMAFDTAAWVIGFAVFAWLRLDADVSNVPWTGVLAAAMASAAIYVVVAGTVRLHQGRAMTGSLEQMLLLGATMVAAGLIAFVANLVIGWVPRSIPVGGALLALVLAAWARAAWRSLLERDRSAERDHDAPERVLVIGAGQAGCDLVTSMVRDPQRRYEPAGLVDDDRHKRHRRYRGVPVLGTTAELTTLVERTAVTAVIIAIPSATAETVGRLRREAARAQVAVKVLPSTDQLLADQVGIRDIRDVNITDVLGRNQVDTDVAEIADYLTGRRVLVTGAGGSIGSELCRQLHRFGPAKLFMLDRDESALHAVQLSIHGRALLDSDDVVLCDIRDVDAVQRVFATTRPDVVFHAAALKHLPMLEQYPAEAVKTNVIGTQTVLEAADLVGAEKVVNISTDKAANPSSVLGWSKRVAERLTAEQARTASGTFLSVRFGNVLGSRGSVLTAFAEQIAAGGPLTVTHPDVTRFFMTIQEACQLVIQAAAIGEPGEALVLDMGEPVRILDVAQQLTEQAGTPVPIEYTGLREGEKMHEDLFGDDEPRDVRPRHPLVSHVPVPPITSIDLDGLCIRGDRESVRAALRETSDVVTSEARAGHHDRS